MNIDNLNKLIALMASLPSSQINMSLMAASELKPHACGTSGCIAGWSVFLAEGSYDPYSRKAGTTAPAAAAYLGINHAARSVLFFPHDYQDRRRYPAHRVIATLKRLRDTYLSTGQVVVDWGPEPGEEPKQAWTAPQVAEVINPALPAELTSLLRNTVEA